MKKKYLFFLFLTLLFSTQMSQAQERFKAAAVGGFNLSQIDGDNFSGYDKFGICGGLRASVFFSKQFRGDFEMLYSQRGAYSGSFKGFTRTPHFFVVNLDYMEIPITGTYKWKEIEKKNRQKRRNGSYHRYAAHIGATIGRLINIEVEEKQNTNNLPNEIAERLILFTEIKDSFIKNDVGVFFGMSVYFTEKIGITIRHSASLTALYSPRNFGEIGDPLINFYVTAVGFYEF